MNISIKQHLLHEEQEYIFFCMKEKLEYDKEFEKNFSSFEAIKGVKISIA
jgi:hypothetical protein